MGYLGDNRLNLDDLAFPLTLRPYEPMSDEQLIEFSERNKLYKIERNRYGELTIMTPVGGLGGTHEMYGSTLSPDVAWLPLTKWESLTVAEQKSFPPFCPEFLIEVRSQSDSRRMTEAKMQPWLDNGAALAWLGRPESVIAPEPVAGFTLPCKRLWPAD